MNKRKRLTPRQKQIRMRKLMRDAMLMLLASIIVFTYAMLFINGGYDTLIAVSLGVILTALFLGVIIKARWQRYQEQKRRKLNYYYKLKREGRI